MRYAINLNLDYATHPHEQVKSLFNRIKHSFLASGFRQDGRLFTIELPEHEAYQLARSLVEKAAEQGGFGDVYGYVTEFYGFNYETASNLLLPDTEEIRVIDTGEIPGVEYIDLRPPADPGLKSGFGTAGED